jgi:hypothetical protein
MHCDNIIGLLVDNEPVNREKIAGFDETRGHIILNLVSLSQTIA